jgi:subtilisin family serine protease
MRFSFFINFGKRRKTKMKKKHLLARYVISAALMSFLLMLMASTAAFGKGVQDRLKTAGKDVYIVIMSQEPAIAYQGGQRQMMATKPSAGQKFRAQAPAVEQYRSFLKGEHDAALLAAGVEKRRKIHDYSAAMNGFAATMTAAEAARVAQHKGVVRVIKDVMRYKQTDATPRFLGLNIRQGPWRGGVDGEGVIVGVIDTGIWPEHPSFADDGTYADLGIHLDDAEYDPCNFGNSSYNASDAAFQCNNKLLGARQILDTYKYVNGLTPEEFDSARDDDGHGTHTASTAAGNSGVASEVFGIPRGSISGIAPRARIIAYKGLGADGGFSSDLAAAIDQAVADGCDVINYSVGGGASLIGADDIAFLFAADGGVFVATSAGNSGPDPASIGGPASVPWVTAVGASTHDRAFISDIRIKGPGHPPRGLWGGSVSVTEKIDNLNLVDAEGIADLTGDTSGQCLNPFPDGTFTADDAVLCNQYDFGVLRTDRVTYVAEAGGGAVIFHNSASVNVTPTDNHPLPTVHMTNAVGQRLKDYLDAHPGRVRVSLYPGQARYAYKDSRVVAREMASFSSRGPNPVAEDIIKPDVTAPGISILAGASPVHVETAAQGQLFQAIMGTSMSSPQVAGIFALLKQAHPDWSPAMAKSALMTSASNWTLLEDGHAWAEPFDAGAGHVDVSPLESNSAFSPGLVYDAGIDHYLGFLCSEAPEIFLDPETTCASLEDEGIPMDPSDLNLASIGVAKLTGSQTVKRTVTNVSGKRGTFFARPIAPKGYTVRIEPEALALDGGASASFTVTITNVDAPIAEWRFGSLSWWSRSQPFKYHIESPIAVKAALFDAPALVEGSGENGALDVTVHFGYTGAYAVAAHGLEPATVTVDNVVQDPDQNFDPADGFSNAHRFELEGAALLRVVIPPEATEAEADLDIFVMDPAGNLVASSTNGGTDEEVNITEPADGTWTVFVHGWATPEGDSDYDLYTWVISVTPGGNLKIDSAPGSAASGRVGTVTASWEGAVPGIWHLGAISHNGGAGRMGLTLVDVDNR